MLVFDCGYCNYSYINLMQHLSMLWLMRHGRNYRVLMLLSDHICDAVCGGVLISWKSLVFQLAVLGPSQTLWSYHWKPSILPSHGSNFHQNTRHSLQDTFPDPNTICVFRHLMLLRISCAVLFPHQSPKCLQHSLRDTFPDPSTIHIFRCLALQIVLLWFSSKPWFELDFWSGSPVVQSMVQVSARTGP
jgi:hypothetical protein